MILVFDPARPPEGMEFGDDGFPIMETLPATLTRAAGDAAGKRAASLEELLGLYTPVDGHPELLIRKPKLRQRLDMVGEFEAKMAVASNIKEIGLAYAGALSICCQVVDLASKEMRPATCDDLLDALDDEGELIALAESVGLQKREDGTALDPNA
jgi:hypothetical protein